MAASYAEITKNDFDENFDANIINQPQNTTSTTRTETEYSENYDAAVFGPNDKDDVSENKKLVGDMKKLVEKRSVQRGGNKVGKMSKSTVFFTVAIDIALAGCLVGSVYKKPSMNRAKLGFGTIGLSLFYGLQWVLYKRYSE